MKIPETIIHKLEKISDTKLNRLKKTYLILAIVYFLLVFPMWSISKFFSIVLFMACCYFFYTARMYSVVTKFRLFNDTLSKNKTTANDTDERNKNYCLFEDVVFDNILKYEYEDKIFLITDISSISGNGGNNITFVAEPENEHDIKAVAIYLNALKIGYVYKGKIQDMINDWICRNEYFTGYINKIDNIENFVTFKVGFYKNNECFEQKSFSLIKTKKKIDEYTSREDNISCLTEGDYVTIEFDSYEDSYYVYNSSYEEIGELPKSADSFIQQKECVGFVNSVDADSSKVNITICIK